MEIANEDEDGMNVGHGQSQIWRFWSDEKGLVQDLRRAIIIGTVGAEIGVGVGRLEGRRVGFHAEASWRCTGSETTREKRGRRSQSAGCGDYLDGLPG